MCWLETQQSCFPYSHILLIQTACSFKFLRKWQSNQQGLAVFFLFLKAVVNIPTDKLWSSHSWRVGCLWMMRRLFKGGERFKRAGLFSTCVTLDLKFNSSIIMCFVLLDFLNSRFPVHVVPALALILHRVSGQIIGDLNIPDHINRRKYLWVVLLVFILWSYLSVFLRTSVITVTLLFSRTIIIIFFTATWFDRMRFITCKSSESPINSSF